MLDKETLKRFMTGKGEISLGQIFSQLELGKDELDDLERLLHELISERWVKKEFCREHRIFEYGVGDNQIGISSPEL